MELVPYPVIKLTCNCENVEFGSYDRYVELEPPWFLQREDGRGICLDACLADEVQHLWRLGVRTTGCCCGHRKLPPTIAVASSSASEMRTQGYVRYENAHNPDIFYARSGWPIDHDGRYNEKD